MSRAGVFLLALTAVLAVRAPVSMAVEPGVNWSMTRSGALRMEVRGLSAACDPSTPLAVELFLRNGSQRETMSHGPSSCDGWDAGVVYGRRWHVALDDAHGPAATLSVEGHGNGLRRFRFRLRVDGSAFESGGISVRTTYHRSYRIWEESDDFVNVCINETRTVRSENHRLYCAIPGWAERRWRVNGRTIR